MGADALSDEQRAIMKAVREAVPELTEETVMKKIIPIEDVGKYLSGEWEPVVRGYVARYNDVCHLRGYDEVVKTMRLDYTTDGGIRPFPDGGNSYGYIKFQTTDYANIEIPFGKAMGGTNTDKYPCTLNGFPASQNGEVIPEYRCIKGETVKMGDGAELHMVIDGVDKIVGVYNDSIFK